MLLQAVVLCHLASDQCVLAFYVTLEPWTPSQLDPWIGKPMQRRRVGRLCGRPKSTSSAASDAAADVETCGSDRLLTESDVVGLGGCFASVSVMNATSKGDVDAALQGEVLGRLEGFLGCT